MDKAIEKPKATDASKASSSTQADWHFPTTKKEALDCKDIGAKISMTEQMQFNIEKFLQDLGADNEIPTGKKEKIFFLNDWHEKVAINNPLWPEELPFGYVYGAFVNAVVYDRVGLKGHNIHAFVTAFKNWITQSGVEDQLYKAYYEAHPEKAPKQLEGREPTKESEETKELRAEGYVNFPPHTVKRQVEILEIMHGSFEEALATVEGAKSYRRRLYNTMKKYKEEGNWPE